ncbi:MAG: hypothetical protein SGPRY_013818 [Prymnesium sp.]
MLLSLACYPGSVSSAPPRSAYLEEYASLFDHEGMLRDSTRMAAYHQAIRAHADELRGKVVLDVGTGTGVLAVWAAQAGARAVYAVEATPVASHAQTLVDAHGLGGVVSVLRGTMEELELPEPVDVIISEWMGYFLLRESMVQSVLYARDRWLKPGGVLYPARARLVAQQLEDPEFVSRRREEVEGTIAEWEELTTTLLSKYDLDLAALSPAYNQA